ncbi:tail fiber/spike domain-containing protein [Leminorella grimontii]|uniref:tail fiber/spike domain-containing protein n=1 Tax=Leminorella grimontii TaxID=82981 RepID=UPI0020860187|nr:tail fiber domain-containing protein [Leminorella grimontii]GKX60637.1 hypothetical protein SOASR031_29520 [Leminorella grimontii]
MARYNTGNPVPSNAVKDFSDNAQITDELINLQQPTTRDRFGNPLKTWYGITEEANQAIQNYGYVLIDSFEVGATLTQRNQALHDTVGGEYYRWDGELPKTVPAGSTPDSTGGVGVGAWIGIGDASLRDDLSKPGGDRLVGSSWGGDSVFDDYIPYAKIGSSSGTVCAGDDARLNTVNGKTGGVITSYTEINSPTTAISPLSLILKRGYYDGTTYFGGGIKLGFSSALAEEGADMYVQRTNDGVRSVYHRIINGDNTVAVTFAWHSNGNYNAYNGSFISASDERIKEKIERITDPLDKMKKIKGVTYVRRDTGKFGIGFIAQDVQSVFPDAVYSSEYNMEMPDGSFVNDVLSPDTSNVSAALHHEAILALMDEVDSLKSEIKRLKSI